MRVLGREKSGSARAVERACGPTSSTVGLDRHADVRGVVIAAGVAADGDGRRAAQVPGEAGERDGA